ncbi:hypothetical protein [Nocardioides daphniae]|uniref:Uncharacterized protein n=1 Tax=Nocardioides daphniae TaxID=402297 RepID=A0ABQ1QKB8_9ACTN|nr:hypothetical protein [Nocardioides daphniae]GGD29423.1 hypothetical protein GCM10007231_31130 [Nocardioides daphniae]
MKAKKVILILLVGFLLYWMFSDPAGLADSGESLFSNLWELLIQLFEALLDFFSALG